MDPGFARYNFDSLLLLKSFGNLSEMPTDCNLASFIHLEHLNSQEFLEFTGTHESEEPWSLSSINFNSKHSCEYYKKMVLKAEKE